MEAVAEIKDIFGLTDEKAARAVGFFEALAARETAKETTERIETRVEKEVAREIRHLATKEDLLAAKADLQQEIGVLRGDMHAMEASIRGDMHAMEKGLRGEIAGLAVSMEKMSKSQTRWMAGLIVAILLGVLALVATRPTGNAATPIATEAR